MVAASEWLNTDKTQCQWPPFRSAGKLMQAVRNRIAPSAAWELLNIHFHAEYETYEEAINKQEELVQAQKYGMYAAITLQESKELTVVPTSWINEQKTQCYWPPFKSPEKCLEAVKNRHEPEKGEKPWEMLNIDFHKAYATYEEAKEKHETVSDQKEQFSEKRTPQIPKSLLMSPSTQSIGIKRKRGESPGIGAPSLLTTSDMGIVKKTEQIMKRVNASIETTEITDQSMVTLKSYIVEAISKITIENRKKTTIGIFGKSGEGKSTLLSAILGKENLLPSGSFGACTAVVSQVEANLSDFNYTAEIEFISKEEWEKELQDLVSVLSDDSEDRDDDMMESAVEKITALYGKDAYKKTLEELKIMNIYAKMYNLSPNNNITISKCNASEFADDVACYIQHNDLSPGGWFWPLVKSVKIKIPNFRELLEHIVLIDLPGSGDCNKIRDDLWRSKLRDCSSVWVVSAISRATTDKGPWEMLKHCIEELGPGGECKSINFICTMTDDIDQKEYCKSTRLPDTTSIADCILHRNDSTKNKMEEKFEHLNPGIKKLMEKFSMDVFTVSSKTFFEQNPVVQKPDTEIPKLQDVLKNLNKSINRELARDYVNEAMGVLSLIQSFLPSTDEAVIKTKFHDDLKKNLNEALNELERQFDFIQNNLDQCLSNGVLESVQQCLENARAELIDPETDNRGYHKILKALCKKNGHYWSRNWEVTLDLNKCLARHMKENISEEFSIIFSVNEKSGKSLKEHLDKFSIIQRDKTYHRSSMFHHIQNFIKTQETKLKASCSREILEKKKEMYASIETTIQTKMTPCYGKAAKVSGKGSFMKMQNILTETIESLKEEMFSEVKEEVLKKFRTLKLYIKDYLESELNKSIELFLLTTNTTLFDVSREIEDLEKLSNQLS
nr:nuclear GTPase SLIP-GC-like isoform X2 [Misgurnus anguillicaudatus]